MKPIFVRSWTIITAAFRQTARTENGLIYRRRSADGGNSDAASGYQRAVSEMVSGYFDSQGAETGHIPHTAPFLGGEGDPAAGAVQCIRFRSHGQKIYGDDSLLVQGYDAILRWFDYMDAHSEKRLVHPRRGGRLVSGRLVLPGIRGKGDSCRRHLSIRSTTCMDCRK